MFALTHWSPFMRPSALAAAVVALCASAALPADAAGLNTASAAHRAIYNLTLASSRGGEIIAARGTMGYEVIDACDGWAVRQRLSMTLTNTEGQDVQMVSDYATWESKDGLKFRFHMKQTTDTAVTSQTDGDAKLERAGGPGEAHYTVPEDTTKPLPAGTLFPMAHTSAILAAAEAGKKFIALPLFDGTDDSGGEDSFVVALDWKKPCGERRGPDLSGRHALLGERCGRQSADGLRRLRHGREDGRTHTAAAQVLRQRPAIISAPAVGTGRSAPG
jgi:hypothetical protein